MSVMDDVLRLRRNDVEGAVRVARRSRERGDWSGEAAQIIIALQDNPDEILERLRDLEEKGD